MFKSVIRLLVIVACLLVTAQASDQVDRDASQFDDTLLEEALSYPDWFKTSFGDLRDDVKEAREAGKRGLMVYFGQKRCAYCEQFLEVNLSRPEIRQYVQQFYDVVPIDIWGVEDIVDTDGSELDERGLSLRYKTNFTPSLVFYDNQGKPVYRIRGYYPPYRFKAALNYVTEGFYQVEKFSDYLARAEPGLFFQSGDLIERDFFERAPVNLKPGGTATGQPLAVFFESGDCHACELLHTGPLSAPQILEEIEQVRAVQLDVTSNAELVTPDGSQTTARQWASDLDIFYTPTILLFDPDGNEVMRVDSVVQFYRLWGILDYVNKGGYNSGIDYQAWRLQQRETTE